MIPSLTGLTDAARFSSLSPSLVCFYCFLFSVLNDRLRSLFFYFFVHILTTTISDLSFLCSFSLKTKHVSSSLLSLPSLVSLSHALTNCSPSSPLFRLLRFPLLACVSFLFPFYNPLLINERPPLSDLAQ